VLPSSRSLRPDQPVSGRSHLTTAEALSGAQGGPPKSAGFGLPVAIYVVVSSMVGVGVLTTSGFTVASIGSNQLNSDSGCSVGSWPSAAR
jgi:hypothetical protein